jgi:hypothetical protein
MGKWFYIEEGQRHGPVDKSFLEEKLGSDKLSRDTQVWCHGMEEWKSAATVNEFSFLEDLPPPMPAGFPESVAKSGVALPIMGSDLPPDMFCPKCGEVLKRGADYCEVCSYSGFKISQPSYGHYNKAGRFNCNVEEFSALLPALVRWLSAKNFETQILTTKEGGTLVQIVKRGGWRKAIGMSTALNVLFNHKTDVLVVEIGAGRWMDKVGVGVVSVFILWPLAVTSGIGAWNQINMPTKIFKFIDKELDKSFSSF